MCSVYGALVADVTPEIRARIAETFRRSAERGRDSWGLEALTIGLGRSTSGDGEPDLAPLAGPAAIIGNRRAEPTTEWVRGKRPEDVQPFRSRGGWLYSLNGTIANDVELLAELHGAPATDVDAAAVGVAIDRLGWDAAIARLEGAFAIVAAHADHPGELRFATNYKPLFVIADPELGMVEIASQRSFMAPPSSDLTAPYPREIPPYSTGVVSADGRLELSSLYEEPPARRRVLAVCSGGLDSVVVAWDHYRRGDAVTLLHIDYGCRARSSERAAVERLAAHMERPLVVIPTDFFTTAARSRLTDPGAGVDTAGRGEHGAEHGLEWVPARNTVLMAFALAYVEAHDFDVIALGNNLEESSGGFPDNEQEYVNKLQALIPYALKPYRHVTLSQPCGTLMKHEIVRLGHDTGAPLDLSWSCYEGGTEHCGRCGPCYMRIVAHLMNGLVDPVFDDRWSELQQAHGVTPVVTSHR